MANGSTRWLTHTSVLAVGVVLGFLLRFLLPAGPVSGSNSILVGPAAKHLTIPELELSKSDHDVVWWNARNPRKSLWIEFEEEIFEGMTPGKFGKFRVQCNGANCFSGPIREGAPEKKKYKYWQVLVAPENPDNPDKEDGWIVIQK